MSCFLISVMETVLGRRFWAEGFKQDFQLVPYSVNPRTAPITLIPQLLLPKGEAIILKVKETNPKLDDPGSQKWASSWSIASRDEFVLR